MCKLVKKIPYYIKKPLTILYKETPYYVRKASPYYRRESLISKEHIQDKPLL
jgi:hypothetical protein